MSIAHMVKAYLKMALLKFQGKIFKINFAVTYSCPARCETCNIWKIYLENPELKKKELKLWEIEEIARKNDLAWVSLTGGEPFTRKDIDRVAIAFSPPLLSIPTNGAFPKTIEKKVEKIVEHGIWLNINVSLDGPKEVHESLRRISFEKAIETLKRLDLLSRQYPNLAPSFEFTINPKNWNSLEKLYKILEEEGLAHLIPSSTVTFMHSGGIYHKKNPTGENFKEKVKEAVKLALKYTPRSLKGIIKRAYLKGVIKFLETGKMPVKCTAAKGSVFVDPYGNVKPCIMLPYTIFNLRETDYIINVKKSEHSRALSLCRRCWTPCEVYQSIMFNVPAILSGIF